MRPGARISSAGLGNRKTGRAWMRRFTSTHRSRLACRFTGGAFGLGTDRRHIRLPVRVLPDRRVDPQAGPQG